MRSTAFLVAFVLLGAMLSGCFSEEGAPAEAAATNQTAAAYDLANVTVDDGMGEMDMEVGHMPHLHDYWRDQERITIMDEDVTVAPEEAFMFTFFNLFRGSPGVGGKFVQLPDGAIVYEGTGKLDLTVTWTEATMTGMGVAYKTAASTTFSELQPVASGETLTVDVTPEMSDMPHEKTSRWAFFFRPASAGQTMIGTFHVKVDIVRLGDITVFPGHPELFGDANTLVLFSGAGTSSQSNFVTGTLNFATGAESQEDGVAAQKVVPMETLSMTANLTITSADASLGEVTDVWFLYKSADSSRYRRAELVSGDMTTGIFQFAWPVEMEQTDSPYAQTSQWRFDVRVGTQTTGVGGPCDRCADVKVEYTVEIVAYDSLLAEAGEPDEGDGN